MLVGDHKVNHAPLWNLDEVRNVDVFLLSVTYEGIGKKPTAWNVTPASDGQSTTFPLQEGGMLLDIVAMVRYCFTGSIADASNPANTGVGG